MKKYLIIISLILTSLSAWCNIQLPWDSLFSAYGLTQSMTQLPILIIETRDARHETRDMRHETRDTKCEIRDAKCEMQNTLDSKLSLEELDIRYNDGYCAGLWHLTPPIARLYGLTINNEIDERYDIRLASEAAAKYLKDLLAHYGNEQVTMLAYIHGAALIVETAKALNIDLQNVTNEEIKKIENRVQSTDNKVQMTDNSQFSTLDSLYRHIGYVKYKFNHPIRTNTLRDSLKLDSMFYLQNAMILPSTRWISEAYIPKNINTDQLAAICESEYEVMLAEQAEIDKQKDAETQARIAAIKKANAVKIYHVKSGDTLSHIAKRHRVSVRQLKQWNNLKSDMIRIGQKLKIHTN